MARTRRARRRLTSPMFTGSPSGGSSVLVPPGVCREFSLLRPATTIIYGIEPRASSGLRPKHVTQPSLIMNATTRQGWELGLLFFLATRIEQGQASKVWLSSFDEALPKSGEILSEFPSALQNSDLARFEYARKPDVAVHGDGDQRSGISGSAKSTIHRRKS